MNSGNYKIRDALNYHLRKEWVSYSLPSTHAVVVRSNVGINARPTWRTTTTSVSLRSLGIEYVRFTRPNVVSKSATAATVHTTNAPTCSSRWAEKCVWFSKSMAWTLYNRQQANCGTCYVVAWAYSLEQQITLA